NSWALPKNHSKTLKISIVFTILLLIIIPGCTQTIMNQNQKTTVAETSAADPLFIHQKAIAIDMHVDTAQRLLDEHVDIQQQLSDGHFDAGRAKAGGLDAQFFSIW